MEDYITLVEIYIHNSKLFKTKNLKSFIKNHKIQDNDMVKLKSNKIGIKQTWIKKNLPSFNLKLQEIDPESYKFFEVQPTLEKYNCKNFNPINLNLDSTMVEYFLKDNKRTAYFNQKGLIKVMMHFNDLNQNIFNWIGELFNGSLQQHTNNLNNIIETLNLTHIPVVKNINGNMVLSNHLYNINKDDIIVDFKKVGDLKKEPNLQNVIENYKCPLYTQLQLEYQKGLEDAEKNFNDKLKELKQEKVIQHLKQELDKEKSLKDQMFSLTQSFIPTAQIKQSQSPYIESPTKALIKLKPSKIQ